MKLLTVFALTLLPFSPVFGDLTPIPRTVTGNNVNLRVSPGLKSEIVGQLQKGRQVEVILTDGEWSAIVPPPGIAAWVSARYVKDGAITGSRVNVRSGPGVSYGRLTYLREGTPVTVLQEEAEWVRIALPETGRLWVDSRYLSSSSPPAAVPTPEKTGRFRAVVPAAGTPLPRPSPLAGDRAAALPASQSSLSPTPVPRPAPLIAGPIPPRPVPGARPALPGVVRSYTGFIRKLDQPVAFSGRVYQFELVQSRYDSDATGFLTGDIIDLRKFQSRQVRLWAVIIDKQNGRPALMEVRGAGVTW
ncbi:MAG: SH3 domain-containing protein [PVC group bacterium]